MATDVSIRANLGDRYSSGFSVIVPVCNEEKVLRPFLRRLSDGLPFDADVIISLNGCSDESALIVSDFVDTRIHMALTERANKALAIRKAETLTHKFPRFYIDADVDVSGHDLCRLAGVLAVSNLMMISPKIAFKYPGATYAARVFNNVWTSLPYVQGGCFQYVIGISESGRARWGEMPDVLADDTFMKCCVPPDARDIEESVTIVVRLPTNFGSIIRVRRRIALGLRQLRSKGYGPAGIPSRSLTNAIVRQPVSAIFIYVLGVLLGRIWARLSLFDEFRWVKDESSR